MCPCKLKSFAKRTKALYLPGYRNGQAHKLKHTSWLILFTVKTKPEKQRNFSLQPSLLPDNCPFKATVSGLALLMHFLIMSENEITECKLIFFMFNADIFVHLLIY